jgi:hypothetical protein
MIEVDWTKNAEAVILVKDASKCKADVISLQNDPLLRVEVLKVRGFSKGLIEL